MPVQLLPSLPAVPSVENVSATDLRKLDSPSSPRSTLKAEASLPDRAAAKSQPSNDELAIQVRISHTHHALLRCHAWT